MRVAFITQCRPCRELGGGRAQFEIAAEWVARGRSCTVLGPEDLMRITGVTTSPQHAFEVWLAGPGADCDVVDYDRSYVLPARASLPASVCYVARSVLFVPFAPLLLAEDYATLRQKLVIRWRKWRESGGRAPQPVAALHALIAGVRRADAFNVCNSRDAALATALGVDSGRVLCLPYAVSADRKAALEAVQRKRSKAEFVFVGSFEARKGSAVLPRLFARLKAEFPDARLTLLGTGGEAEVIRGRFPAELRDSVCVVPAYSNAELPIYLEGAEVGLFPSRHEGFPFAVLEQLHAGVPVVAYDAPGACDQLPEDWLTPPGDWEAMAARAAVVMRAVQAGETLSLAKCAREYGARFRIEDIAERTWTEYQKLRAKS